MAGARRVHDLEDRLVGFAVSMIDVAETLPSTRAGNHIAGQLIRSGTSPAPNYGEAQGAESHRDFVHKLRVVYKELRETRIWLRIVTKRGMATDALASGLGLEECEELIRVVAASLRTAKANANRPGDPAPSSP